MRQKLAKNHFTPQSPTGFYSGRVLTAAHLFNGSTGSARVIFESQNRVDILASSQVVIHLLRQ
jgi:hypothetical protein